MALGTVAHLLLTARQTYSVAGDDRAAHLFSSLPSKLLSPQAEEVEIGGRRLRLSNFDKVLYPAVGFTKAQVIDYYARIGPIMLPHLAGRPVTMVRWPGGVDGKSFFEKRCPSHAPKWVRTTPVAWGLTACVVDELAALVWMANLASLELHTPQAGADTWGRPDSVVFDLDPGPRTTILDCCRVGLDLHDLLEQLDLTSVVKTSGSKGLHLAVPLHTDVTDDETKEFALALGQLLAKRDPKRVTVVMKKEERAGKVFVDWSQNDQNKTTIAAYSLRAKERPMVSTPISWDEVADAIDDGDPSILAFEASDVLERVDELGDLYAPNLELVQELPRLSQSSA